MLQIISNSLAMAPNTVQPVQATGGTGPYVYSVAGGGAGGTVDAATGVYTAPSGINDNPALNVDTIVVTDSLAATASLQMAILSHLELICDIIQSELGLAPGRVYVWDQKINEPTDFGLFVVVQSISDKVFGNNRRQDIDSNMLQGVNILSMLQIDIKSRGNSAKNRKEEVPMALHSYYAQAQQKLNSFKIASQPSQITTLSENDGMAIPYRFTFTVAIQYLKIKSTAVPYYDSFPTPSLIVNP